VTASHLIGGHLNADHSKSQMQADKGLEIMGQRRAISQDAKLARRGDILTAAETLLRAVGYDDFTMQKLAGSAGLAKGTLYLYFTTREELVLALYTDLTKSWIARFLAAEKASAEKANHAPLYDDICQRFYNSFIDDDLLVDLAARAASALEPHVPSKAYSEAKRASALIAKRLGGYFCAVFGVPAAAGQRLAWAFLVALSGAQQRGIRLYADQIVPEDIHKLSDIASCKNVFLNMVLPLTPK
jgi:AcrR family transcriptional regulator